jgi:hypothetical protein
MENAKRRWKQTGNAQRYGGKCPANTVHAEWRRLLDGK